MVEAVGRRVDLADLIDANEVAELLGLAGRKVVAANRSQASGKWRDFPDPVIERRPCYFWLRQDVEHWLGVHQDIDTTEAPQG